MIIIDWISVGICVTLMIFGAVGTVTLILCDLRDGAL